MYPCIVHRFSANKLHAVLVCCLVAFEDSTCQQNTYIACRCSRLSQQLLAYGCIWWTGKNTYLIRGYTYRDLSSCCLATCSGPCLSNHPLPTGPASSGCTAVQMQHVHPLLSPHASTLTYLVACNVDTGRHPASCSRSLAEHLLQLLHTILHGL